MQKLFIKSYKGLEHLTFLLIMMISNVYCWILFYVNGVKWKSFNSRGFPYVHVSMKAKFSIGANLKINNGVRYSGSGTNGKCRFMVRNTASLLIGDNVGMSDVTITCYENIHIKDHVLLGVGVEIRDSDIHALDPYHRQSPVLDRQYRKNSPVIINENVFVGAKSMVLKGVTIGRNSVIAAGSVVTKSVPENQIWGGNPARFIKNLESEKRQ